MLFEARGGRLKITRVRSTIIHSVHRKIGTPLGIFLENPPAIAASSSKTVFCFRGTRVANSMLTQPDEINRPGISKGGFNGFTKQR